MSDMHPQDVPAGERGPARSPTGRVPRWVIDEAAGRPVDAVPWRAPVPVPPPRGWHRLRGALMTLLVLALSLGAAVLAGSDTLPWVHDGRVTTSVEAAPPMDRPAPGSGSSTTPLGTPLPAPPGGGSHAFVSFQDDGVTPVSYDPCREIHYVLRTDGAPPGAETLVHGAVARIAEVTGLRFVFDGYTDEPLAGERAPFQPERYGDQWAPVLIGWQGEVENPSLAGDIVGEAGSTAVSLGDGPRVYVTGTVSLDAGQLPGILAGEGGTATVRAVLLHELGHLVGLSHVDDDRELMYPETRPAVTDFAAGDRTGLAVLGQGGCVPEL